MFQPTPLLPGTVPGPSHHQLSLQNATSRSAAHQPQHSTTDNTRDFYNTAVQYNDKHFFQYEYPPLPVLDSRGVSRHGVTNVSDATERERKRRVQHSNKERERRERMNAVLELLENLNPKISKRERLTKLDILELTASYIKELQALVGYQPPVRDDIPRRLESQSFSPDFVDNRCGEHLPNDQDDWRVLSASPPDVQNRHRRRNSDNDDESISSRAHRRRRHNQVAADMPLHDNFPAHPHAQLAKSVASQDAYAVAAAAAAANVDVAAAALPLPLSSPLPEPRSYTLTDISARYWNVGLRSPDDMPSLMSAGSYDSTISSIAHSHASHSPVYTVEASEGGLAYLHESSPVKSSIGFLTT
ncbi:hypothetical protein IWW37_003091 [Coemansia sp. RSA 2050]|nr:hypothetical protein IWW37_003091 [Coemansia sp. RSA 2050]